MYILEFILTKKKIFTTFHHRGDYSKLKNVKNFTVSDDSDIFHEFFVIDSFSSR